MKRAKQLGKPQLKIIRLADVKCALKLHSKNISDITAEDIEYFIHLHRIVDQVYQEAADTYKWTWSDLAREAGLANSTVESLGNRCTKWPRFMTVYKLCRAVGWELVLQTSKKATKKYTG